MVRLFSVVLMFSVLILQMVGYFFMQYALIIGGLLISLQFIALLNLCYIYHKQFRDTPSFVFTLFALLFAINAATAIRMDRFRLEIYQEIQQSIYSK